MFRNMSFEHPWLLALGAAIALLVGLAYLIAERQVSNRDLVYSNLDFFSDAIAARSRIPILLRGLWVAALACLVLAVSGPRFTIPVLAKDGSVFICIDTSGSMRSTDVQPTRAGAARAAAAAFIDQAPAGTENRYYRLCKWREHHTAAHRRSRRIESGAR
jgi:Ca-activated chloride channel family protein